MSIRLLDYINIFDFNQDWLDTFLICKICKDNLNKAYEFRELCLKSDLMRRGIVFDNDDDDAMKDEAMKDEAAASFASPPSSPPPPTLSPLSPLKSSPKFKQTFISNPSTNKTPNNKIIVNNKVMIRRYACVHCKQTFETKPLVQAHIREAHVKCPDCRKVFATEKLLSGHMRAEHAPPTPPPAAVTPKTESDDKFMCHFCAKLFTAHQNLQMHLRSHSETYDFKCEHCPKAYKRKRSLQDHLAYSHGINTGAKVRTKERKYQCHICPNAYVDRNRLHRHLRVHAGVKPFKCQICGKAFSDNAYLKQHLSFKHKIVVKKLL